MSKNRKIFNLFKFIDEIYNILRINNDTKKEIYIRFFDIMAHAGAFFHFIFDNILWMVSTRIISHDFFTRNIESLKYYRYTTSMWRAVFNMIYSVLDLRRLNRKEKEKKFKLLQYSGSEPVGQNKESLDDITEMFDIKFKKRILQLDIFHTGVRCLMLYDVLNLP